jgi:uncharacterized protein YvpB
MKFTMLKQLWEGRLELLFSQARSYFNPGTTIVGTKVVILGSFLSLLLLNPGPDPMPVIGSPTQTPPASRLIKASSRIRATPKPFVHPTSSPTPTNSPTPTLSPTTLISTTPALPEKSQIKGISGHPQSMPLSCEARSAVDWAAYFGKSINEYTFFNGIPVHDNPDKGFVGSVYGSWGQIPPNPYGVHAKPIAQRLREFGLNAKSVKGMTYKELKAEIASGQPVIVWVVGHVNRGTPVPYTSPGGAETVVAKFEHTVIVIGYTEHKITVLDGAKVYTRYKGEFKKSWAVLGNQAVIWID